MTKMQMILSLHQENTMVVNVVINGINIYNEASQYLGKDQDTWPHLKFIYINDICVIFYSYIFQCMSCTMYAIDYLNECLNSVAYLALNLFIFFSIITTIHMNCLRKYMFHSHMSLCDSKSLIKPEQELSILVMC